MRDIWREVRLGDVVTRRTDFIPIRPDNKYVILGVQRSGWGFVEREPILGSSMKFAKLLRVDLNDLVYRTITAFEAPSAVAGPEEVGHFVTPQTFPVFKIDDSALVPAYMSLLTTWPKFHEAMASRCTGTVLRRKTLAVRAFEALPILLPPLDEQRRIVDLIGAMDDTIAGAAKSLRELNGARDALASVMYRVGEPVLLSSLGRLVTGSTPSTRVKSLWEHADVAFVTPGDLPWTGSGIQHVKRYVDQRASEASTRLLDGVGVLQVCIGATVGKVGVVQGPALFNQQINAVFGLTHDDALVLGAAMSSPTFQSVIKRAAGTSTMPMVSKGSWGQLGVAWPASEDRLVWAGLFSALAEAMEQQRVMVLRLRNLRSDLLTALLSGEHEIPRSYDDLMGA